MSGGWRLRELADRLGGEVVGDGDRVITGIRPLDEAGPDHLSFLHNLRYVQQARESRAGAVLVADPEPLEGRDLLVCKEPYLALARALEIVHPATAPQPGIHPSAVVAADAELGEGVSVGPHAVVGDGCSVGGGTVIGAGCVLGRSVSVGCGCLLHPLVTIADRCRIGERCVFQSGVVIGSDGFGFATVGGVHHKVPQVGIVVVEDDVELGANVCVDRATLGETRIGRGTKVDNLVQIAHNVVVGEGCILVSQSGIAGSTRLGHHVVLAGQSGVAGHLEVGDQAQIAAKSAVFKSLPGGRVYSGIPAQPHREWLKAGANLRRLESMRERLRELEKRIAALESDPGSDST